MNINNLNYPREHPHGMLVDYKNAYEKQHILSFVLAKLIDENKILIDYVTIENLSQPDMVKDGLLETHITDHNAYKLTITSIGLLFSVYGRL